MNSMHITIVTDSGAHIGQGHLQRMLLLAWFLTIKRHWSVTLVHTSKSYTVPPSLQSMMAASIPKQTACIIRDMRDSTEEEIQQLQAIAPVIVIDDCGKGRPLAFRAIDLLPNIYATTSNSFAAGNDLFLYGYNFYESLQELPSTVDKDIDCFLYASTFDSQHLITAMGNTFRYVCSNGNEVISNTGYTSLQHGAHSIARSKVVITHFGITVYEAMLCNCNCILLNPTTYHQKLSHTLAYPGGKLHSLLYDEAAIHDTVARCKDFVSAAPPCADIDCCRVTIATNLKNFADALTLILNT